MYMRGMGCACKSAMNGLSMNDAAVGGAAGTAIGAYYGGPAGAAAGGSIGSSMFGGGGGGGGGSGQGVSIGIPVTVSTQVSPQISPQISPTFVQQDHPTDSAVTTTTSQTPISAPSQTVPASTASALPPIPVTGAMPGIDTAPNPYAYPTTPLVTQPATILGMKPETLIFGALALVVGGIVVKKMRGRKPAQTGA